MLIADFDLFLRCKNFVLASIVHRLLSIDYCLLFSPICHSQLRRTFPRFFLTPPDSVPIHEFLFSDGDKFGRYPIADSLPPFTCGITGKPHSAANVKDRIEWLSAALALELGFDVNNGSEFAKVIGLFSFNTVCTKSSDSSFSG